MAMLQRESGSTTVLSAPVTLPVLRLRSGQPRLNVNFLTLKDLSKRQDVVKALLQLRSLLGDLTEDEVRETTRRLFLLLSTIDDMIVKEKSADLLGRVACEASGADVGQIASTLLSSLSKLAADAAPVTCQILLSLATICQRWSDSTACQDVAVQCFPIVAELLPTGASCVRRASLHLLAALAPIEQRLQASSSSAIGGLDTTACSDIHRHCAAGISDDEPRVRAAALQSLLRMNDGGVPLHFDVYQRLSPALVDDYVEVREEALQLVWRYCRAFPDKTVSVGDDDGVKLSLLDDGFVKICDMMNDLSMAVRWKAASLLGTLYNVSFKFLQQTLDKKLMSHLRAKSSEHDKLKERYRANMTISEWESGRHWGDGNLKKKNFDPTDVQLISNGACGAFVHGLEDEFLEVRKASVESIANLAVHRPRFAALCADYVVDMLNDEIQSVRLAAMDCLQKIMMHQELRDDQLETFLSGLSDSNAVARVAVRDLLTAVQLSSTTMLHSCLKSLQVNLSRYPGDQASIYKCMAVLGRRHSNLVMASAPKLLQTDSIFATTEPDIEQSSYIARLILILNALPYCPTLKASFPTFMGAHYAFLASSLPHLVPQLEFSGNRFIAASKAQPAQIKREQAIEGEAFIQQSLKVALGVSTGQARTRFLKVTLSDMRHLVGLSSPAARLADWSCLYLEACLLLEGAIHCKDGEVIWNKNLTAKVLSLSYQAEQLFTGLSPKEMLAVAELRVVAHVILLLNTPTLCRDDIKWLLKRVQSHDKRCQTFSLQAGACLQNLLMQGHELERGKMSTVLHCLQDAVEAWRPTLVIPDLVQLYKCQVVIDQPSNPDHIFQFSTSLATAMSVDMTVCNIRDARKVILQVLFPDQSRRLFYASAADVEKASVDSVRCNQGGHESVRRLSMDAIIGHHLWSGSSHVELSAVLAFIPDFDESLIFTGSADALTTSSPSASSTNLPPLTPAVGIHGSLTGENAAAAASSSPELLMSETELAVVSHKLLPLGNTVRFCIHPKERIFY